MGTKPPSFLVHDAQRDFLDRCRRVVVSETISDKVKHTHELTRHIYVELIKEELKGFERELIQPSSQSRYPFDLRPVERALARPGRPKHFQSLSPKDIPKRPSLRTQKGIQHLLHSLAHIELCAVEVDAAMLYMYPHAPKPWVLDWVAIMDDEQRHFILLSGLLKDANVVYGDLPVHFGLWEAAMSGKTWLEQIAIVNRYQEASGVDASQSLVEQLQEVQSQATARLIQVIHDDEVKHVSIGNQWWNWAFSHHRLVERRDRSLTEEMGEHFFNIIATRLQKPWRSRVPIDTKGRRKSGFSDFELQRFTQLFSDQTPSTGTAASSIGIDGVNKRAQ